MSRVTVYDCTLRDGMQGEGMSLSAQEKVRVAHVLDELDRQAVGRRERPADRFHHRHHFALRSELSRAAISTGYGTVQRLDTEEDE